MVALELLLLLLTIGGCGTAPMINDGSEKVPEESIVSSYDSLSAVSLSMDVFISPEYFARATILGLGIYWCTIARGLGFTTRTSLALAFSVDTS